MTTIIDFSGSGRGRVISAISGMTASQAQGFLDQNGQTLAAAQTAAQQSTASAADAADAVLLAQQAQAASLEVPDANVSALIGNPATDTRAALSAAYAARAVDSTQGLIAKIEAGLDDATMLVVGDSTTAEPGRWVGYLAATLGEQFPTHSVNIHQFNISGTLAYDAPTTIATGTGPRALNIYNAAIGGHSTFSWKGAKGDAAFDGLDPDLIVVALGHNEGGSAVSERWHQQMLSLTEDLTARSDASLILVAQNPQMVSAGVSADEQEPRREVYRNIAAHRGFGFIDVCQAFLDTGQAYELTSDGTHPTATGYQLWADTVAEAFVGDHKRGAPRPQPPSGFTQAAATINRNPTFESGLAHWLTSGATAVLDTTHTAESSAVKITGDGAGASFLYQNLPLDRVRGRWITVAARLYVPAGSVDSAGVVALSDSAGMSSTTGHSHGKDGWRWDVVTRFIPAGATTPRVRVYASVAASTGSVWLDRAIVVEGRWPREVARADPGGEWQPYTPALSSNITLGSGTIVAAFRADPLTETVDAYARIALAADSVVNGSVSTTVGLPVDILSAATVISKDVTLVDASGGVGGRLMGSSIMAHLDRITIYGLGANGAPVPITGTAPFAWADGDSIEMSIRYRY